MIDLLNLIHYITKKNRIMMIFITLMITLVMIPVLISSLSHIQQESLLLINLINEKKDFILFAITILVFLASFVAIMTSYLNKGIGGKDIEKTSHILYKEIIKLNKRLSEIENKTSSGVSVEITESERDKLISDAKKRIIGNTLLLADNSLKSDISDFKKSYSLHKLHTDMILRLESEIDRLNRRGGLNLAIGTIIALTGILSLAYFLYSAPDIVDGVDFFIHHLPKLSFVIVVELFAYFFLRLYKNGFDEIKYFQNEITNIEMKAMSLKYAQEFKNEDIIKELAMHLMKTERNFILEKGQTTVSIEKDRLQNLTDSKITTMISEIIKLKQK
ncbi:TPA: hypothetical protein ACQZDO_002798 [Escherichia coli]|uniref:hypothetical protein n=2 Tax=Escherichia coli TaxID=562 RepID=UPI000DA5AE09|nr:hypothetical protein [Escherichia coli]EEZ5725659.1 hypothetical protein [Escherichia coli O25]EEU9152802.1 hypothetical protein [Escherichia coli]EEV5866414.1 hypothetical protein [Escherichia coli]EEW6071543.1 hypothetical protein [Escherichia coli]EFH6722400.1 hypothetical protein [Escherichia coli]